MINGKINGRTELNAIVAKLRKPAAGDDVRFYTWVEGKEVSLHLAEHSITFNFRHRLRSGDKFIDMTYKLDGSSQELFLSSMVVSSHTTKGNVVARVMSMLSIIMFKSLYLGGHVLFEGKNIRAQIEDKDVTEFKRSWLEMTLNNVRVFYTCGSPVTNVASKHHHLFSRPAFIG